MGARLAVFRELARAGAELALAPARLVHYAFARRGLERAVLRDLAAAAAVEEPALAPAAARSLTRRPLRVFVSAAEPSGERHAISLVEALRRELNAIGAPPPEVFGLGGPRLAAAGVRLLGDPVAHAAMGADVLRALPFYLRLLTDCARAIERERPDALVPVDSPALHVPLGRIARRRGVPVVHFVTPQYWAWAPWRVGLYKSAVDRALTILPFEPAWFARAGVATTHVGHPLLDALEGVPVTHPPVDEARRRLVLLPGSRASVIARNLPWMLAVVARTRLVVPDLEVLLPHERDELLPAIRAQLTASHADEWVRLVPGRLHPTLATAHAAFSVSGTVLLDLVHHRLPTVVVYRLKSRLAARLARRALTVPWFASPNLLAGGEVVPEHVFAGAGPLERVAEELFRALVDDPWRVRAVQGLERAAQRLGPPGAARRAARAALATAAARSTAEET